MTTITNSSIIDTLSKFEMIDSGVSFKEFASEMEVNKNLEDNFSLEDVKKLVDFCAEQSGYWSAEWLFSAATSPNEEAEKENEVWEKFWETWHEVLAEKVPEAKESMIEFKNLMSLQFILQRRLEYNKEGIIRQPISTILSKTSIILNKIGFKGLANSLYSTALYPKGTVARP